jgi:tetratricopeptide (TPR) repeat protein
MGGAAIRTMAGIAGAAASLIMLLAAAPPTELAGQMPRRGDASGDDVLVVAQRALGGTPKLLDPQQKFYEDRRRRSELLREEIARVNQRMTRLGEDGNLGTQVQRIAEQQELERQLDELQLQLKAVERQLQNITAAYEEQKQRVDELRLQLAERRDEFDPEAYARAMAALDDNDNHLAENLLEQSVERHRRQERRRIEDNKRHAQSYFQLGRIKEKERFDVRSAEGLYQDAIRLDPDHIGYQLAAAGIDSLLGRHNEAELKYLRAREIAQRKPDSQELAQTLAGLGTLYWQRGRYLDAEEVFAKGIPLLRASGADAVVIARAQADFGINYWYQQRLAEADTEMASGLKLLDGRTDRAGELARVGVLSDYAGVKTDRGDLLDAETMYRDAIRLQQKHYPDSSRDPNAANLWNELGFLYKNQRRFSEAHDLFANASKVFEHAFGPDHPNVAVTVHNDADAYCLEERFDVARPLAIRAMEIREKVYASAHRVLANSLSLVGYLHRKKGDFAKAEQHFHRAREMRKNLPRTAHLEYAKSLTMLGNLYLEQGQISQALTTLKEAIEIEEGLQSNTTPDFLAWLKHTLVSYAQALKKNQEIDVARSVEIRADTINARDVGTCAR